MICIYCGAKNDDHAKICTRCGTKLFEIDESKEFGLGEDALSESGNAKDLLVGLDADVDTVRRDPAGTGADVETVRLNLSGTGADREVVRRNPAGTGADVETVRRNPAGTGADTDTVRLDLSEVIRQEQQTDAAELMSSTGGSVMRTDGREANGKKESPEIFTRTDPGDGGAVIYLKDDSAQVHPKDDSVLVHPEDDSVHGQTAAGGIAGSGQKRKRSAASRIRKIDVENQTKGAKGRTGAVTMDLSQMHLEQVPLRSDPQEDSPDDSKRSGGSLEGLEESLDPEEKKAKEFQTKWPWLILAVVILLILIAILGLLFL